MARSQSTVGLKMTLGCVRMPHACAHSNLLPLWPRYLCALSSRSLSVVL